MRDSRWAEAQREQMMDWGKLLEAVLPALLTLAGGWVISTRITDRWDRKKADRDRDLATMTELSSIYGQFFSLLKVWDSAHDHKASWQADDTGRALLRDAADAEGRLEALIVKVAAERRLTDEAMDSFAELRQAFKSLRQAIRAGQEVWWWRASEQQYTTFKVAATRIAHLLTSPRDDPSPTADAAAETLQRITLTTATIREKYGYYRPHNHKYEAEGS